MLHVKLKASSAPILAQMIKSLPSLNMGKSATLVIGLLCCASLSFGQVVEARRAAANKLWTNYGRNPRNPSSMPKAVPHAARNVDTKFIAPNFKALETALTQLSKRNGGIIRFRWGGRIRFNRHITIKEEWRTRKKIKTIVVQGKNIVFDGQNRSSLFVIRGNVRVVFQDATFQNANLTKKIGTKDAGGAIEVTMMGPHSASLRVRGCRFINNKVSHYRGIHENANGAGIRMHNNTTAEVFGCTFKNNRAVTGAAIGGTSIRKLTIVKSTFDGNISNGYISNAGYMRVVEGAAAVRVDRTLQPIEIYGCRFLNNAANTKVSVIEVFIEPVNRNPRSYPHNTPALVIDKCHFIGNKHYRYRGAVRPKKAFFAGCLVFHSGRAKATMKMTNSVFNGNEVGQANIRMINDFDIANCIFANTKYLPTSISQAGPAQRGAVFLQKIPRRGTFRHCTFYRNEPSAGQRASDIMFWAGDVPAKVSVSNSIFYRTNTNARIKQVHRALKGWGNNQYIPRARMASFGKVATGRSSTSNPNIRPNRITNMCLGANRLPNRIGGLANCGRARTTNSSINTLEKTAELLAYPNPVTNQLNLKGVQAGDEVVIFDQLGQVVFRTILAQHNRSLSLSHLKSGIYSLVVKGKPAIRIVKK